MAAAWALCAADEDAPEVAPGARELVQGWGIPNTFAVAPRPDGELSGRVDAIVIIPITNGIIHHYVLNVTYVTYGTYLTLVTGYLQKSLL